jgi:glycosidase
VVLLAACAEPEGVTLCPAELAYVPEADEAPDRVEAVGDFNGWTLGASPLRPGPDGVFALTLSVPPGEYSYRLRVDGTLRLDPLQPLTRRDSSGNDQSLLRVPDCRAPDWTVRSASATPEGELSVEVSFVPGTAGDRLDTSSLRALLPDGTALEVLPGVVDGHDAATVRASGLEIGKHTVRLTARDRGGRQARDLLLPLWVERSELDEPFAWEGALIYQVMIDRFMPSGEPLDTGLPPSEAILARHGGDLDGLAEVVRSGYFEELGVRALWITPLYDNPDDPWPWYMGLESTAYHGYWPVAAREVEPLLGGEAAARELVDAAHARGLRVILDVVPNHVHIEHPYFVEHADDGWFNGAGECVCGSTCSWADDLDRCWFSEYLPDLQWHDPDVARQIVDDTLFWLEELDFDGLRIDAIPMMPLVATRELVDATRRRLERGPVDVHLLGETYTGGDDRETIARALGPYGLDGQFDFPLLWELRRVLGRGEGTMTSLDEAVRESERAWAAAGGGAGGRAIMSPFIGNHDVPRFVSEAAGADVYHPIESPPAPPGRDEPYQRLVLAQALVLTLPGAPVMYYGDEIGQPGATDPDNRRPMRFGEALDDREEATLEAVARLGRLRACLPALRRGSRATLAADDDLYVYLRDANDGAPAIVALNRGETEQEVLVDLPPGLTLPDGAAMTDVVSGAPAGVANGTLGPAALPARSAMVLVPDSSPCVAP